MTNPEEQKPAVVVEPEVASTATEEQIYTASQWQLVRWRFAKHKMAVISLGIIGLYYLVAVFCEFMAPYPLETRFGKLNYAKPQRPHFVDTQGKFHLRPFVYGLEEYNDPVTWRLTYNDDPTQIYPIHLFVRRDPYKLWGMFESNLHLFGVKEEGGTIFLLGTDRMGRDLLSRIFFGARVSLSIGLIGVLLSLVLGALMGGISGFYGGLADTLIQRLIELLRSTPTLPLWMGLSAALPPTLPPLQVYFGITVILSIIGWTGLARVTRGKILALREEDFVMAAKIAGASEMRIILRHLLPSFTSHLIVTITLAIPGMILGETALSFLGLGLRPPVTSWGVLLQEAQQVQILAHQPWLLTTALFLIVAVLSFNFVGDGLRDAADPYSR